MIFTICGKIKPYVRMTRRGKWINPQAQEYLNSQKAIRLQLRQQMASLDRGMLPEQTPLAVDIFIYQPDSLHRCDLDNLGKAIIDAAQGIIFKDDRWIDDLRATRHIGEDYRVVLKVVPLGSLQRLKMKLIRQYYQIIDYPTDILTKIEQIARTCYKSESKIKPGSNVKLIKSLLANGHHSMIEFGDITVKFITNRGVTHELVRHRLCSFAQESTRYVEYDDVKFIEPVWWDSSTDDQKNIFFNHCRISEQAYLLLLNNGWQPQQAREVLPNSLKTEIVVKANLREWRHIFQLRCSRAAHPQIRGLMVPLLEELKERVPVIFDDIIRGTDKP